LVKADARVVLRCDEGDRAAFAGDAESIEVVTDRLDTVAQAEGLVAKCWAAFGPLAGLVVLPEEASPDWFADGDDDWTTAMHAALKIPFFLTRAVATRMEQAAGGCIVHVCGATRHGESEPLAVHEVTRSASITMTLVLAKAFPPKVRLCAVVGSTASRATDAATGGRTDVTRTTLFLLGEESLGTGVIVRLEANRR
jgi:NAD(P)-dependent dehydrogenase (short-subunit alcohol dehydrogenase family)